MVDYWRHTLRNQAIQTKLANNKLETLCYTISVMNQCTHDIVQPRSIPNWVKLVNHACMHYRAGETKNYVNVYVHTVNLVQLKPVDHEYKYL